MSTVNALLVFVGFPIVACAPFALGWLTRRRGLSAWEQAQQRRANLEILALERAARKSRRPEPARR